MPFSSGVYTVAVDFGTEATSPPIGIAKLDEQMADLATALGNCILRDGTGNPTAAISFGSQDVTAMNTLTISNALADTNTLILSKGGSKIVLARSSDDAQYLSIGSDSVGGSNLSLKNIGGVSAEIQIGGGTLAFKTNALARMNFSTAGVISLNAATAGTTFTVGVDQTIVAGGSAATGIAFCSSVKFGVFVGSGAPTMASAKGSLYLRSDGSSTSTRAYINTDGATTWTAITTVA